MNEFFKSTNGLKILFGVLIIWTLLIAFGSFQTPGFGTDSNDPKVVAVKTNPRDFRRPLIVGGTMAAFLSVWAIALRAKRRSEVVSEK